MKRALVLAGGGVAGIAWELGVLHGIGEEDPELLAGLRRADVVIGTSAGSAVAAQITSGALIADLYSAQLDERSSELEVDLDLEELMDRFVRATTGATDPEDMRRRIGALALETPTVSEAARRAAITARLPEKTWPSGTLLLTAVEAGSGRPTVFTKDSGVDLVDAVAASCAVPGVWPPVAIGDHRYIDGGVRSVTNADLAAGWIVSSSSPRCWPGRRNPGATSMTRSPDCRRPGSGSSMPTKPRRPPSARIHSRRRPAGRRPAGDVRSVVRRPRPWAPSGADDTFIGTTIATSDGVAKLVAGDVGSRGRPRGWSAAYVCLTSGMP